MDSAIASSKAERRKQGKALREKCPRTSQAERKPRPSRKDADRIAGLIKAELLRAKLRGEVSQADYAQANADFDDEIEGIAQQLHALRSQRETLDAFIRFSRLLLMDVSAAWRNERTLSKGYVFKIFSSETVLRTTKTRSF
jgi:hypothetical protein